MSSSHAVQERAPETMAEKIAANTPLMLMITLAGSVGLILTVVGGYYTVYQIVTFLGN